jgi:hypothetical protein
LPETCLPQANSGRGGFRQECRSHLVAFQRGSATARSPHARALVIRVISKRHVGRDAGWAVNLRIGRFTGNLRTVWPHIGVVIGRQIDRRDTKFGSTFNGRSVVGIVDHYFKCAPVGIARIEQPYQAFSSSLHSLRARGSYLVFTSLASASGPFVIMRTEPSQQALSTHALPTNGGNMQSALRLFSSRDRYRTGA